MSNWESEFISEINEDLLHLSQILDRAIDREDAKEKLEKILEKFTLFYEVEQ